MMTSKEALKCLEPFRWDDKKEIKAYEVLEKLVERDTPKKVIKNNSLSGNCPNCNRVVDKEQVGCPYCLQRLDWSDVE